MRPLAYLFRDVLDLPRDPGVVLLDQAQLAQVVFPVGVEAGADEDHLGLEGFQPRHPGLLDQLAHGHAPGISRDRQVDHVGGVRAGAAERIEGMLEKSSPSAPDRPRPGCLPCHCRDARRNRRWPRA
jgi:hypothetical protein